MKEIRISINFIQVFSYPLELNAYILFVPGLCKNLRDTLNGYIVFKTFRHHDDLSCIIVATSCRAFLSSITNHHRQYCHLSEPTNSIMNHIIIHIMLLNNHTHQHRHQHQRH